LTVIDPSAASIVRGLVPLFDIGLLGVEPRVFVSRKRAPPAVGEIKARHVEHQHRVMCARASSKDLVQDAPEIVFTLFGFHCHFRLLATLTGLRPVTSKQSWDLLFPLSRDKIKVAI
jgi:hypothetical protein